MKLDIWQLVSLLFLTLLLGHSHEKDPATSVAMSFNISGFDPDTFYAVNSAVNILLFAVLPLPTLILCGVCILGLILAKDVNINWKMRVILLNILSPEVINVANVTFLYIGYPIRAFKNSEQDLSCNIALTFAAISFTANVIVIPLFSIAIYIFLKYGVEKLKWSIIITMTIVSWLASVIFGVVTFYQDTASYSSNGFCIVLLSSSIVFIAANILTAVIIAVGFCTVLVFSILSCCHVTKSISASTGSESPSPIKKVIAKVVLFQAIKVFAIIVQYFSGSIVLFTQQMIEEHAGVIVVLFLIYFIVYFSYDVIVFITLVVMIIFLKPVHDSLKQLCKKPCGLPAQAA